MEARTRTSSTRLGCLAVIATFWRFVPFPRPVTGLSRDAIYKEDARQLVVPTSRMTVGGWSEIPAPAGTVPLSTGLAPQIELTDERDNER